MPWNCRLVEYKKGMHPRQGGVLKVGDMFLAPDDDDPDAYTIKFHIRNLSDFYYANNKHRRPIIVVLPGPTLFCIDSKCWTSGNYYGGWTVAGEAPNITITPSINIGGTYHGFLQNGIITDDVDGRVFDELGYEVRP